MFRQVRYTCPAFRLLIVAYEFGLYLTAFAVLLFRVPIACTLLYSLPLMRGFDSLYTFLLDMLPLFTIYNV